MNPRVSFTGPFGLSIAALALVAIFLLVTLPSLLNAALVGGSRQSSPTIGINETLLAQHQAMSSTYQARLNGRSAFFRPPARVPEQPINPSIGEPIETQPEPIIDTGYTGPTLIALVGKAAWFMPANAGGRPLVLRAGQERAGLKLLSVNPPWSADVLYRDHQHTLTLFDANSPSGSSFIRTIRLLDAPVPGLRDASYAPVVYDDDFFGDGGSR